MFGDPNVRQVRLDRIVQEVNELEYKIEQLSDADLKSKTAEFKEGGKWKALMIYCQRLLQLLGGIKKNFRHEAF